MKPLLTGESPGRGIWGVLAPKPRRALKVHRRAKLRVFGRRQLVERIELEGWPIAHAAAMTRVSRQTATKWVRRYQAEGPDGLEDRSSRPRRSPRSLAPEQVAAI